MPSEIEELQQQIAERALDNTRRWFGPDRCDLIGPVDTEGGAAGDSVVYVTIATNLEIFVEEITGASAQTVIGGEAYVSSHLLELKREAVTLNITPRHKVKVYPRAGKPERYFDKLVQSGESFAPLVILKGSFVRQGFTQ